MPFAVTLILLNFFALLVANYQAFRTRRVKSVLSESKYIAITVASIPQAALVNRELIMSFKCFWCFLCLYGCDWLHLHSQGDG